MNREIEESFINRFIVKDRRERLKYELFGKKRRDGIGRLCHGCSELLIPERIIYSGKGLTADKYEEYRRTYSRDSECYIMAYDLDMDGICCGFDEALDKVLGNGMAAVIICGGLAVIETEQCFGEAVKYIMGTHDHPHFRKERIINEHTEAPCRGKIQKRAGSTVRERQKQ